jgi:hypothetical protein
VVTRLPPDWLLIRQVVRIVHNAPGGGLHRAELAEQLGLPAASPVLREALMIAYRRKQIDFCRQYVVKPVEELCAKNSAATRSPSGRLPSLPAGASSASGEASVFRMHLEHSARGCCAQRRRVVARLTVTMETVAIHNHPGPPDVHNINVKPLTCANGGPSNRNPADGHPA